MGTKFLCKNYTISNNTIDAQIDSFPRQLIFGTKIIFDTVYQNYGDTDRVGYNTVNDPYYTNNTNILPFNSPGNTFSTPREIKYILDSNQSLVPTYGLKLIAQSGDSIILKKNKRLFINGQGFEPVTNIPLGDTLLLKSGSTVIREENAEIFTYQGGILIDEGSNGSWSTGSCYRAFNKTTINLLGSSHTVNNGGFVTIDSLANLRLGNNTTVTFDGVGSYLDLKNSSKVFLGTNSKIVFKNGAYLKANNVTFNSPNNEIWQGIVLENAGESEIKNCTFQNATEPVKIVNTVASWAAHKITGNTITLPAGGSGQKKCIYAENVYSLLVQNNILNADNGIYGLHIKNTHTELPSSETFNPNYTLNIIGNSISGGTIGMALMNLTLTPYYVANNMFNGTANGFYGIIAKKVTGNVRNNVFNNTNINQCIRMDYSDMTLFGNNIYGNEDNISVVALSTLNMQPLTRDGNDVWIGGSNLLTTKYANNVMFQGSTLPKLNWGKNCFSMLSGSTGYHLLGTSTEYINPYNCIKNSWSHIVPNRLSNITYNVSTVIVPNINSAISCAPPSSFDSYDVINRGFGLYDTVRTSVISETRNQADDEMEFMLINH